MSARERSNLILDFAKVLFANFQATEQTIEASVRLGRALGLRTKIIPRWGELELISEGEGAEPSVQVAADPTGVDMGRVASTVRLIEKVEAGRVAIDDPGRLPVQDGSGLVQLADSSQNAPELLSTIANGTTAAMIVLAMSLGLIIPKLIVDKFSDRSTKAMP